MMRGRSLEEGGEKKVKANAHRDGRRERERERESETEREREREREEREHSPYLLHISASCSSHQ